MNDDVLRNIQGGLRETKSESSEGVPEEARQAAEDPSRVLDRYLLVENIGEGAMGRVWKAWDTDLRRWVAIKLMREESSRIRERFLREARVAAGLGHPNLITVFDAGQHGNKPFLVMELIRGGPVKLKESLEKSVRILHKVALGLHKAHVHGVVHRDLKPGNVLVDEKGEPHVVDFGLAHLVDSSVALTRTGAMMGTPTYMAPEQVSGNRTHVGPATDVYALGVMLYEAITGFPPFGGTPAQIYDQIMNREPARPDGPSDLVTICRKAMDKVRNRRYFTAEDFAFDLERYMQGEPIDARPPSAFYRFRKLVARKRSLAIVAVVGLVLTGTVTALLLPRWMEGRQRLKEKQAELDARSRAQTHLDEGRELLARLGQVLMVEGHSRDQLRDLARSARAEFEKALREVPDLPEALLEIGRAYKSEYELDDALKYFTLAVEAGKGTYAPAVRARAVERMEKYIWDRVGSSGALQPETEKLKELRLLINEDMDALRKIDPDQEEFFLEEGIEAFCGGAYDEAARKLTAYAEERVSDFTAWFFAGFARIATNELELAIAALNKSAQFRPMDTSPLLLKGYVLTRLERLQDAEATFSRIIKLRPNNGGAYSNRGAVREDLAKYDESLADHNKAIDLEPSNPRHWNNRANLHQTLQQWDQALSDANEAIKLDPTYFNPHWIRFAVYRGKGQGDRAIASALTALDLRPDYADGYYSLGVLRMRLGLNDEALKDFATAIRLNPKEHRAWNNRGTILRAQGNLRESLIQFSNCINANPKNEKAYYNRALTHADLGRPRAALADVEEALKLRPDYVRALHLRGFLRAEFGQYKKALEDVAQVLLLTDQTDENWKRAKLLQQQIHAVMKRGK